VWTSRRQTTIALMGRAAGIIHRVGIR
jgi:hypothetical protein